MWFFSLPGGLATEWHGDSLCQQRLAGSVIGWLGLWIPGFSNLIVVVVHGRGFVLYSLKFNLTLLFSNTHHFESFWHIMISYFHFSLVFGVVNVVSPSRHSGLDFVLHFGKDFEVVSPCNYHLFGVKTWLSSYSCHFKASDRGCFHHLSSVVEKCKSMSTKSFFAKMRRSLLAEGRSRSVGDGPTQEWWSVGTTRVLSKWWGLESKIIQNLCHAGVIGNLSRRSKGSYSHEAGSRWFTPLQKMSYLTQYCFSCPLKPTALQNFSNMAEHK